MSSILTNNSAMVALQTLNGINKNLNDVQSQISTGKKVANAKDNAAVWAISSVMKSDVKGFKGISESLSLGSSTVSVARQAAETVTDLLTEIKGKIVAAQEENVDRAKIQTDIVGLRDQIQTVVNSAQFNGLNLIDGGSTQDVDILSSLDRDSSGTVTASQITVARQDLSLSSTATGATFGATNDAASQAFIDNGGNGGDGTTANTIAGGGGSSTIQILSVADGNSYELVLDDTGGDNSLGQRTFQYVANADDSVNSVAANLENQLQAFLSATGETSYSVSRTDDTLTITTSASAGAIDVTARTNSGGTAGTSAGGLGNLASVDVTTDAGATSALTAIEGLIQTSIDAASAFGSAQDRIDIQADFVSKLTDAMTSGIGSLVDANLEEASARLQALQVQQQLGTQALSIANQAPQSVLSLFR